MFDYHIHSQLSFDSKEAPIEICRAAVANGLKEICFTDHYDYNTSPDLPFNTFSDEAYTELYLRIRAALSTYENQIWWLYHSGRTAKEIAGVLGKSEKSIQNAIYRIRRKLRTEIPNPSDMPK